MDEKLKELLRAYANASHREQLLYRKWQDAAVESNKTKVAFMKEATKVLGMDVDLRRGDETQWDKDDQ